MLAPDLATVRVRDLVTNQPQAQRVDSEMEYRLLGVRLEGRGAFHRETKLGASISASKLTRVTEGDFVYSRLFAWQGAFSLIGPDLEGCFVSNEFPVFRLDKEKVDSTYLLWWLLRPETLRLVEADCTGSTPLTRNRFKETFFLDLRISLPSLSEQRRIVAKVQEALGALDRAATLHTQTVADFDRLLMSIARDRRMFEAPKEPMARLAPLVRRPVEVDIFGRYPELGVRSFGKSTFHKPVLEGIEVGTKNLFWIKPGDLLFQIVFAWEGAVAIATDKDDGRCGSHRFLSCVCDPNKVLAEWLRLYFLSPEGLSLLGEASPGGAGRNRTLGLEKLARIQVPVPNLDDQEVVRDITRKRDELTAADTFQRDADALRRAIFSKAFRGEL